MNLQNPTSALSRNGSGTAGFSKPLDPDQVPKVLVADDDKNVLYAATSLLARAGFSVTAVFGGEQAWEMLDHENYDLLVTDNDMPGLAGINLVGRIREAGMSLPVIMISGSLSCETLQNYPQLQIAALMPKPFNTGDFLNIVRNVLQVPDQAEPLDQRRLFDTPPPPAKASKPLHKHVLIADDDTVVRGSLAAVLESEGYEVAEASNGIEAVTCAIRHRPDLVLLDLNMPHADGWTAFSQLNQVTPLLPVIVITARPNQYPEAVRVGVDAFMEKPLNIPILVQAVKRLTHEDEGRHVRRITDRAFVTRLLGKTDS
ncbi:MAG TPA: response regulator [Verrucomicrobiae bacterium]|nr:response regulator [Verrucomicrobiae bacterium]